MSYLEESDVVRLERTVVLWHRRDGVNTHSLLLRIEVDGAYLTHDNLQFAGRFPLKQIQRSCIKFPIQNK